MVNAIMKDNALVANQKLEEILQEKCAKKIKTTLQNIDKE